MSKNSWHTLARTHGHTSVFRVASQVNLRCGFWVHKRNATDMEIIIVVYEHLMATHKGARYPRTLLYEPELR